MISNQTTINMVNHGPLTAIEIAARCYRNWMGQVSFEHDLANYMARGYVVTRPSCFAMAHIVTLEPDQKTPPRWTAGEPAWFVRMAVGNPVELFSCVPYYLPWIAFCRRNDGRVRVYKLERLIRKVKEQEQRKRR